MAKKIKKPSLQKQLKYTQAFVVILKKEVGERAADAQRVIRAVFPERYYDHNIDDAIVIMGALRGEIKALKSIDQSAPHRVEIAALESELEKAWYFVRLLVGDSNIRIEELNVEKLKQTGNFPQNISINPFNKPRMRYYKSDSDKFYGGSLGSMGE